MPGIGIIVNRNAAGSKAFDVLRGKLGIDGTQARVFETETVDEIDRVAGTCRRCDIDLLAVWGGDGTIHHVLSCFIRVYGSKRLPRFAFLRAGTHNACARSIGVTGSPASILERLVRSYKGNRPLATLWRRPLRVDPGGSIHYGFTLATGYLQRFFEVMHRTRRNTPGKTAVLLASMFGAFFLGSRRIQEMFGCEPSRICIGDQWIEWPVNNGIAAATMEQVGLGIRPFSRAAEVEGCFHAMVFRITPARFARVAWSLARGRLGNHAQHLDRVTHRLVVEANKPISYAFDGDLFCAGNRLEITTGPRLQLVRI